MTLDASRIRKSSQQPDPMKLIELEEPLLRHPEHSPPGSTTSSLLGMSPIR